jgi:hypothetical protein
LQCRGKVGNVLCFPSFPWLLPRYLIAGLEDALWHLELESAVDKNVQLARHDVGAPAFSAYPVQDNGPSQLAAVIGQGKYTPG